MIALSPLDHYLYTSVPCIPRNRVFRRKTDSCYSLSMGYIGKGPDSDSVIVVVRARRRGSTMKRAKCVPKVPVVSPSLSSPTSSSTTAAGDNGVGPSTSSGRGEVHPILWINGVSLCALVLAFVT